MSGYGFDNAANAAAGATSLWETAFNSVGFPHEKGDSDYQQTLTQIATSAIKASPWLCSTWRHNITSPATRIFTIQSYDHIIAKICKFVALIVVTTVVAALNLAMCPFYIIEKILGEIALIFTAPFTEEKLINAPTYMIRYGDQVPKSLANVVLAIFIKGPGIAISATLLDFAECSKAFG